jgi:protease-4
VYFHSSNILTSGGYWIALSGDKIYTDYGAIIGSIGVKGPDWIYYNSPTALSSGFIGTSVESPNGIQLYSNTAGKSKDIFNPFRAPSNKEKLDLQKIVDDIYEDFINLVSSKRKIEKKYLKNQIGAMIFNSKQAKLNYLIDDQKNLNEIFSILTKKLKIDSVKIISNRNSDRSNFFNLIYEAFVFNEKILDSHKLKVKNKYCNNLFYELSSVSTNTYGLSC